jgi:uncharacterized metal-binding protein
MCASRVLRDKGIQITYEIVVAKEGVDKLPSLDFTDEEVEKIANKIVNEFLAKFLQTTQRQT